MSTTPQPDGSIIIDTQIDTQGFKAGSAELTKAIGSFKSKVNSMQTTFISAMNGNAQATQKLRGKSSELRGEVERLEGEMRKLGNTRIPTEDYQFAKQMIEKTEREIEKLEDKQAKMQTTGVKRSSSAWRSLQYEIDNAKERLNTYKGDAEGMENAGTAFRMGSDTSEYQRMAEELRWAKESLDDMNTGTVSLRSGAEKVASGFKKAFGYARRTGSTIFRIGSALSGTVRRGINAVASKFKSIKSDADGTRKKLLKMGLALIGMRGLMAGIRQLVSSALNNNEQLKNQLTALKGVLGTALSPVMTFLVNALTKVVTLADQVYQLFTGTSLIAQYNAKQSEKMASATADAAKNAKKYKNQLASFDTLNVLSGGDSEQSNSSDDEKGALFTPAQVRLGKKVTDFLKKLKTAFKKGDFKAIGGLLADALNRGLTGIEWGKIRRKCKTVATRIAELINAFVKKANWNLIGKTIGEAFKTLAVTITTFAITVDWGSIGKAIATALNGFNRTGVLVDIGRALANLINIPIDLGYGFAFSFDWSRFGKSLAESLSTFFSTLKIEKAGKALGKLLEGICKSAQAFFNGVNWSTFGKKLRAGLKNFFSTYPYSNFANSVRSFLKSVFKGGAELLKGGDLGDALGKDVGQAINDFFSDKEFWGKTGEFLSNAILTLENFLITAVSEIDINKIGDAFYELFANMDFELIIKNLGSLLMTILLKAINAVIKMFQDIWYDLWNTPKWNRDYVDLTDNDWLVKFYRDENGEIKKEHVKKQIGDGFYGEDWNSLKSLMDTLGEKASKAYVEGSTRGLEKWMRSNSDTAKKIISAYGKDAAEAFSKNGLKGLVEYITNHKSDYEKQGATISKDVLTGSNAKESGTQIGEKTVSGVKSGATSTSSKKTLENTGKTITSTIKNTDAKSSGETIGTNIIAGVKQGIRNVWDNFKSFWKGCVDLVVSTATSTLGIHSPSTVFKAIGEYIMRGLHNGVNFGKDKVLDLIGKVAQNATERMKQGDYSISPTVNPVEGKLSAFSDSVSDKVSDLLSKLQTIANNVTFVIPDIVLGKVTPHTVRAGNRLSTVDYDSGNGGQEMTLYELYTALIQMFNNLSEHLGDKFDRYATRYNVIGIREGTEMIIGEVNRKTRTEGKSPLMR